MKVLFSNEEIEARLKEVGKQITKDYNNEDMKVVVVLKGAFMTAATLVKYIDNMNLEMEFTRVSSYLDKRESTGKVNVLVDIKSKRAPLVQYKVPEQRADEFCKKYVEKEKKDSLISNTTFVGAVLGACLLMNPLLKKIENGAGRMTLAIVAGILTAVGSNYAIGSALAPKHAKFLNSYNAELYESKPKNTVADIISK